MRLKLSRSCREGGKGKARGEERDRVLPELRKRPQDTPPEQKASVPHHERRVPHLQHLGKMGGGQSVQFSRSVISDSLRPHGLQHARPLCPSPAPRVYPNSCPLSQWCPLTISSSVVPFSSCLQSFPASGSFQMSQFFASGGQSIEVSASASVLPMNIQDWFPLGWTGWLSLQSKGLQESPPTPQFKSINPLALSFLYGPTLTFLHDYWKNHNFD